uniref:Uncharacterized protein n=1 Tax=Cucumis sativus TaxID=3659 RepID=A0A0A0KN00_CUCSA
MNRASALHLSHISSATTEPISTFHTKRNKLILLLSLSPPLTVAPPSFHDYLDSQLIHLYKPQKFVSQRFCTYRL